MISDRDRYGGPDVKRGDPKKTRTKKETHREALNFAVSMFSLYIRKRDKRCVTCGSTDRLQCSHVERSVRQATRFMEGNAFAQCARCHVFHHNQSETPLRDYQLQKIGPTGVQMMYSLSRTICKRTASELWEIGAKYRNMAEEME